MTNPEEYLDLLFQFPLYVFIGFVVGLLTLWPMGCVTKSVLNQVSKEIDETT